MLGFFKKIFSVATSPLPPVEHNTKDCPKRRVVRRCKKPKGRGPKKVITYRGEIRMGEN